MKALCLAVSLLIMFLVVSIFAEDRGILGNLLVEKLPLISVFYGTLVWLIVTLLNIPVRKLLDRLPVEWSERGVKWYWRLLEKLMGEEVILHNPKFKSEAAKIPYEQEIRNNLLKNDPILSIKMPWEKK